MIGIQNTALKAQGDYQLRKIGEGEFWDVVKAESADAAIALVQKMYEGNQQRQYDSYKAFLYPWESHNEIPEAFLRDEDEDEYA